MLKHLPKKIKVDNVTYSVKLKKNLCDNKKRKLLGVTDCKYALIQLDETAHEDSLTVTLAHEIAHALLYERNIIEFIPKEHVEAITDKLAKGFIQILRDNPGLIVFVRKGK